MIRNVPGARSEVRGATYDVRSAKLKRSGEEGKAAGQEGNYLRRLSTSFLDSLSVQS